METLNRPALDLGVATLTLADPDQCGDLNLVAYFAGGVLVAVMDGAGHGAEAAQAARTAQDILSNRPDAPLPALIRQCHDGLRTMRGVVMSLASFDTRERTMTWAGVGNVEGRLLPRDAHCAPRRLLLSAGMLGHRLATVTPSAVQVNPGDTLILATDGVRESFDRRLCLNRSPQKIADDILAQDALQTDDALVLVARFLG